MPTLAVDFGGTWIKTGVVESGDVLASEVLPACADQPLEDRLRDVERVLLQLVQAEGLTTRDCLGVGVGFPATVDRERCRVLDEFGKYRDAVHVDLRAWAQECFRLPLAMDTDARLAALGEWRYGAGRGCDDMVGMTLGTGVGSCAIVGGQVLRGHTGQAGVLGGHQTIDVNGPDCYCGNVGCAESLATAANAVAHALAMHRNDAGLLASVRISDFRSLFETAAAADPAALDAVDWLTTKWAAVVVNLIHAYDPERVVIGGGVMRSAHLILPRIQTYVRKHVLTPGPTKPMVCAGELGDDAALIGAEHIVHESLMRVA